MGIINILKVKTTFLLLFPILVFVGCNSKNKEAGTTVEKDFGKPNVIIVFTDDQGYGDLGYHGNPWVKTPKLDDFARGALELTNFHVGTTCAPSRAGLLTGRNANRNNAWHTIAGCSILLEEEETLAEVFSRNGYQTAMIGKWHLGDNYPYRPQDRGFKEALYHGGGGVGQTPDYWNNNYFDDTYFRNGVPEKFEGYCTDVWFDEAIKFLDKQEENTPFFMYLAPNAAHGPFNVPAKYAEMYATAPLTAEQKRFYGMISNIDDNFGKLVDQLKQKGMYDNTILIFSTDNGTARGIARLKDSQEELGFNAGLRGIKGSHYDGGHRVPFLMSWPDGSIKQETAIDELVAHVDILPTLADLADLEYESSRALDGTSVKEILTGKTQNSDRMLVVDTQRNQWPVKGKSSCVMSGPWRLIDGKELYNTKDDPGQKMDIAEANPDKVQQMNSFYDQWWASLEPDMAYAEIPIGNPSANLVNLTIHDMHTENNLPWNQVQIRQAQMSPDGFYSLRVEKAGSYSFQLGRYPQESALNFEDRATQVESTPYVDGLPESKSIEFQTAVLEIGDLRVEGAVDKDQAYAELQAELEVGSYQLKTNFTTNTGKIIPAYYTTIHSETIAD